MAAGVQQTYGPETVVSQAIVSYVQAQAGNLPVAAASTIPTPPAGIASLFLNSENNNAKTIVDSNRIFTLVDETLTTQLTPELLEANFPAASYLNKWAIVQQVYATDEDGYYQSDGSIWIKRLDDSDFKIGNRTALWDYGLATITYNTAINSALNTGDITYDSGLTGLNLTGSPFNETGSGISGNGIGNDAAVLYQSSNRIWARKHFTTGPITIGQVILKGTTWINYGESPAGIQLFASNDGSSWTQLAASSGTLVVDGTGQTRTYSVDTTTFPIDQLIYNGSQSTLTVNIKNPTSYRWFEVRNVSGGAFSWQQTFIYEPLPFAADINAVNSINKLFYKLDQKGQTKSDNYTLAEVDSGLVTYVDTDAKTITLPATVAGMTFTIMNYGSSGTVLVTVSPNASDKIMGNGFTSADDKDILNTKATAMKGDYVKLVGDGVNGWYIQEIRGIWARQS